jgi:hypothetical protein
MWRLRGIDVRVLKLERLNEEDKSVAEQVKEWERPSVAMKAGREVKERRLH